MTHPMRTTLLFGSIVGTALLLCFLLPKAKPKEPTVPTEPTGQNPIIPNPIPSEKPTLPPIINPDHLKPTLPSLPGEPYVPSPTPPIVEDSQQEEVTKPDPPAPPATTPEYKEPTGGDNPFDNDTQTEITDVPSEELVGEGEDPPGGGIHF